MTDLEKIIEFIEIHGNGTNDGELTVDMIYKYAQALQLQQTGVIKSVCLLGYSFEVCKYTEPKHEACKYCDKFNQTVL